MILKDFFTMVHKYLGKSAAHIEQEWNLINSATSAGPGDSQYHHDCWLVDGEHEWDYETQNRVKQRYMKGWSTKDPFAIDHQESYYPKPQVKPRPSRRILNA